MCGLSLLVIRDTEQRYHLPLEVVLQQYIRFVKPCFEEFIQPVKYVHLFSTISLI